MAESFIFSIADSLVAKLASRAFQEASRVVGLDDHLRDLNENLSLVKAVLLDAEQKQEQNHELREWLKRLKTVFFDAEDVLDEFECQTLRKKVVKAHGNTKEKVSHFFSSSNPLVFRYKMAQQIKDLTQRLDKVAADKHRFSLQVINVDTRVVHSREMTHSRVSDSDVIGRKHDKEKIIKLLMQQNGTSLSVIPIVGIGGLGKTTLAKFVFNDKRIQECFPLKLWVCVSDNFDLKQLIIKIINSVNDIMFPDAPPHRQNLNKLDIEQLQNQLTNKLSGKKILLVLDDVWNEDRVKWIDLRNLIQVSAAGSKILVTTRSHSVASMMGTVSSHILKGLSENDSWSLLVKWAFKEGEENKYPDLVNIGMEIVKKCRGVPLAVRTLGSLLFSKFEASEWEYVKDNEIWNLPQRKDDILPALKLSYDFMPSYLRACFVLFSLYPKDYTFNSLEITFLWRALGLIVLPNSNMIPEDVANQYLDQLMSRSFLQVVRGSGTLYDFQIHDLVHDLALFVAKDECLLINSCNQNISETVRHLSFLESSVLNNFLMKESAVRTLLFPNGATEVDGEFYFVSKFKYLRVLDLKFSTCETLPRSIGKLKHLTYLDISYNYNIKRLPRSVCKLQNLLCFRLYKCIHLEALPKGLKKLISLQHFEFSTKQSHLPDNEIASLVLKNMSVVSCDNLESIFTGVKFPVLKVLNIENCQSLTSLPLNGNTFPELETFFNSFCDNLDLEISKDYEEEVPKLKLKTVILDGSERLVLPKWLQEVGNSVLFLRISNWNNLETFPDWLTSLTHLKTFTIIDCPKLVSLSGNFHHLTALEYLKIKGCPELCRKCQPHVGEFWIKISHIKEVVIDKGEEETDKMKTKKGHNINSYNFHTR